MRLEYYLIGYFNLRNNKLHWVEEASLSMMMSEYFKLKCNNVFVFSSPIAFLIRALCNLYRYKGKRNEAGCSYNNKLRSGKKNKRRTNAVTAIRTNHIRKLKQPRHHQMPTLLLARMPINSTGARASGTDRALTVQCCYTYKYSRTVEKHCSVGLGRVKWRSLCFPRRWVLEN